MAIMPKKTGKSGMKVMKSMKNGKTNAITAKGVTKNKVAGPKATASMVHSKRVTKKASTPRSVKK